MLLDGIRLGEMQRHVTEIQIVIARMQKAGSEEGIILGLPRFVQRWI